MANTRLTMAIQDEILRLKKLGHSQRRAAKLLGVDRATVSRYWHGKVDDFTPKAPPWALEIDWNYVRNELKTVSRKIIFEELLESNKLPSYQAFCKYLKNNSPARSAEVTIKIDRNPGASIEVDWSGDSIQILNPATGELYSVELFVGSMSYSGRIYAEFTVNQKLESFIRAHSNMFTYFGGVTDYIIPDNCKTAVTRTDRYDPQINRTYQDMCKHYNIVVDPADSYSPRHKPNVENAVKYLQTDFIARIRKKTFTSLVSLNHALKSWLEFANSQKIQGRGNSRSFYFDKEKHLLKSLPVEQYELYSFKIAKVHPDCHFQHLKNYYSVPHQYVGKELDIKFNENMVHAFFNCSRIATHKSMKGTYHYSTDTGHYPERKFVEVNYHLGAAKKEALLVGENTALLINKLIHESRYPLKILRKIQGILRLKQSFDSKILDYACGMALEFDRLNYDNIKRFAKSYKERGADISAQAPQRQFELICLQGGICERGD